MNGPRFLMCSPEHFGVEYVINPWMEGQIQATDNELAGRQWSNLQVLLSEEGQVVLLPSVAGLPDLVFTANAALIYRDAAVLSSFRFPQRQPESEHFANWLQGYGFRVHRLPAGVLFEGAGDALFDRKEALLWLGHGLRSDATAKEHIETFVDVEVQLLRLINPSFYHLDTCFCPLERGYLLYYPGAFDDAGNQVIEARVPANRRFALSIEDARNFACNTVNIGSAAILNHASVELVAWMTEHGFQVTMTALSEFMRAGGAAKCLSLRLDESCRR